MADDSAVSSFCDLTGASAETAAQYLAACSGDVEMAISTYFESAGGEGAELDEGNSMDQDPVEDNYTGPRTLDGRPAPASPLDQTTSDKPKPTNKPTRQGGIATMRDLRESTNAGPSAPHAHSDDDDSDGENDAPQNFFTGGEKSGLSVEDPNHKKKGHKKLIASLMKQAKVGGSAQPPDAAGSSRGGAFSGTAHTLGSDDTPSQTIPDPSARPSRPQNPLAALMPGSFAEGDHEEDADLDKPVLRHMTLWSDGFSIEDGPLMPFSDPANKEILENLKAGRAPLQLLGVKFGQRVDIGLVDRQTETYKAPPKGPTKAFEGAGNRLGAPVPAVASAPSSEEDKKPQPAFEPVKTAFQVDNSQPMTSIQIRMGDGQRVVGRFNHTHTIADVIGYINASQPGASSRPYVLQTTFPSRELTDLTQSVKDAGLLNAVVTVKYQ